MEALPVESWELTRPNITTWADDLSAAPNTRDISKASGRVFDLGRHIDILTRPPFVNVDKITPEPEEGARDCHGQPWGFFGQPAPVPAETRTHSHRCGF